MTRAVPVPADFDPVPSLTRVPEVTVVAEIPRDTAVLGVPVRADGDVPALLGLSRESLAAVGFTGATGQTLLVPQVDAPALVAVGAGSGTLAHAAVRDLAAAFALAVRGQARPALLLAGLESAGLDVAAQAATEGVLLARYQYAALRTAPRDPELDGLVLVLGDGDDAEAATAGAARGRVLARAACFARDLANCPPTHLTATRLASIAEAIGPDHGLAVEISDRDALLELGCGGLVGVNGGSVDEARMIKLTYTPEGTPTGHLALVGKGIMYDAGGIAVKPGDETHANMKNDMSGAGSVIAAMSVLRELGGTATVTGYLMCTDNVISGDALKMGDVITARNGTTVEILNTDAEGRLVMMDALVLATEEGPDAIIDIATLTGAAQRALGNLVAAVMGNDQTLVDGVLAHGAATDERVWQLPLVQEYLPQLHTDVADLKNLGGPMAGSITAGLFLEQFVDGTPWAHIDIAGTAQADGTSVWKPEGCTGFGTRLLAELAAAFSGAEVSA